MQEVEQTLEEFDDVKYFETSCKQGKNVKESFMKLIAELQGDNASILRENKLSAFFTTNKKKLIIWLVIITF